MSTDRGQRSTLTTTQRGTSTRADTSLSEETTSPDVAAPQSLAVDSAVVISVSALLRAPTTQDSATVHLTTPRPNRSAMAMKSSKNASESGFVTPRHRPGVAQAPIQLIAEATERMTYTGSNQDICASPLRHTLFKPLLILRRFKHTI